MAENLCLSVGFGYMALAAHTIGKGEIPDPRKLDTWEKALWYGSFLGLYTDIIHTFGTSGQDVIGAFLGPTASLINNTSNLIKGTAANAIDAAKGKSNHRMSTSAMWLKYLHDNLAPNIWFSKDAFDRMFYSSLMDKVDPHYARRLKKKLEKRDENNIKLF